MNPKFPNFQKLSLKDAITFQKYNRKLIPLSDFDFLSLWAWDFKEEIAFSLLHQNLVVKFTDYIDGHSFLSFLGRTKSVDTVHTLLAYSVVHEITPELKLISTQNFSHRDLFQLNTRYEIREDRDNFDYIFSVPHLVTMNGSKLHHKRKMLNRFKQNYPQIVVKMIPPSGDHKILLDFFETWRKNHRSDKIVNNNELIALERTFRHAAILNPFIMAFFDGDKLIGYDIFTIRSADYAVSVFQKADITYKGIYEFIYHQLGIFLDSKGCKYLNVEQDLGDLGIRRSKMDYNPTFLKKYIINPKLSPD